MVDTRDFKGKHNICLIKMSITDIVCPFDLMKCFCMELVYKKLNSYCIPSFINELIYYLYIMYT